jgi:hypothetical protein
MFAAGALNCRRQLLAVVLAAVALGRRQLLAAVLAAVALDASSAR